MGLKRIIEKHAYIHTNATVFSIEINYRELKGDELVLARWMDALFQKSVVLSERSLGEMLSFPDTALPDPEGGRYGLGSVDFSDVLGVNVIGHGGSALGYSAAALYLPDEGISLAWAITTGESPLELADSTMMKTWEALYGVVISHCVP